MRGRYPEAIEVTAKDRVALEAILKDGKTEQRVARRARILLMRADEERVKVVAERVGQSRDTVERVCERYRERGLEALQDAPRSGRPRDFSPTGAGANRKSGV